MVALVYGLRSLSSNTLLPLRIHCNTCGQCPTGSAASSSADQCWYALPTQASSWNKAALLCITHDHLMYIQEDGTLVAHSDALLPRAKHSHEHQHASCGWGHVVQAQDHKVVITSSITRPQNVQPGEGIGTAHIASGNVKVDSTLQAARSQPNIQHLSLSIQVQQVSAGELHSLVLDCQGGVWSIGEGSAGQLGAGPHQPHSTSLLPVLGNSLKLGQSCTQPCSAGTENLHSSLTKFRVIKVAAGFRHSCAVSDSGVLYTWGWSGLGATGHHTQQDTWHPKVVESLGGLNITKVAGGGGHTLAVSDSGDVYVWGWNHRGQLGLGHMQTTTTPTLLDTVIDTIVQLSAGAHHSLLRTDTGQVLAFGSNSWGQLGLNHAAKEASLPSRMQLPEDVTRVTSVQAGWWHTILLAEQKTSA